MFEGKNMNDLISTMNKFLKDADYNTIESALVKYLNELDLESEVSVLATTVLSREYLKRTLCSTPSNADIVAFVALTAFPDTLTGTDLSSPSDFALYCMLNADYVKLMLKFADAAAKIETAIYLTTLLE